MDKLTELLSSLASRLGTTVEHLWPKLVAYRLGATIGTSAVELIALTSGIIVLTTTLKNAKWSEEGPSFARDCIGLVGGALLVIGGALFCSDLPSTLGTIMSPEGGTLAWLMQQVRYMR